MIEMPRHPLAEGQVDPLRMVDEEPQRFLARLLERDQIELGVELPELLLDVLLKVWHLVWAEKKVGQAHFSYEIRSKKLESEYSSLCLGRDGNPLARTSVALIRATL